ncbi:DUF6678 family protein [Shimia sp. Alg240-R146]|uniref:DUF6678 family protein n=1 Tax=Shimia sp. Alg240-R146 TaxID=2993449 RepID=UPI0022E1E6DC|nr:DUF6678 family protein [Shimia sp. Alg240-R146]
MAHANFFSVSNDTKWLELRECVLSMPSGEAPKFRSKAFPNGHLSYWDSDWYYHFIEGGFADIEWFELEFPNGFREKWAKAIASIGFAGEPTQNGLRLFGYVKNGSEAHKITCEILRSIAPQLVQK